jgi:hypothetical protein
MDYFPLLPEDTERTDPITAIHKNIQNEPLIGRIKVLEARLLEMRPGGNETVTRDIEEIGNGLENRLEEKHAVDGTRKKEILERLLRLFKELLKTRYGPLGYIVSTTASDIEKLYGVDTDRDFYFMDGSSIRIPNRKLDPAVDAGGGRRLGMFGERGLILYDPSETPLNVRITDHAVQEIIDAIQKKLEKLPDSVR